MITTVAEISLVALTVIALAGVVVLELDRRDARRRDRIDLAGYADYKAQEARRLHEPRHQRPRYATGRVEQAYREIERRETEAARRRDDADEYAAEEQTGPWASERGR